MNHHAALDAALERIRLMIRERLAYTPMKASTIRRSVGQRFRRKFGSGK